MAVVLVAVVQVNRAVGRSYKFGIYSMCNQPHSIKESAQVHIAIENGGGTSIGKYGRGSGGGTNSRKWTFEANLLKSPLNVRFTVSRSRHRLFRRRRAIIDEIHRDRLCRRWSCRHMGVIKLGRH